MSDQNQRFLDLMNTAIAKQQRSIVAAKMAAKPSKAAVILLAICNCFRRLRSQYFPRPYGIACPDLQKLIAKAKRTGCGMEICIDAGGYAQVIPSQNPFVLLEKEIVIHPRPPQRTAMTGTGSCSKDDPFTVAWSRVPFTQTPNTDQDLTVQSHSGPVIA